ncbi:hypothetical protein GOP47_0014607 [Adiantum capillus-veneris]|uniref:Cyanovirin-N domain-containing protein n=1 Tax=Adiantum capillus-veneris TaxID=13818 RepID=A0A9D4ULT7_ADICA|nr:hypothetical protein GOP47_0014607 [Adiantum capillus-veneris]
MVGSSLLLLLLAMVGLRLLPGAEACNVYGNSKPGYLNSCHSSKLSDDGTKMQAVCNGELVETPVDLNWMISNVHGNLVWKSCFKGWWVFSSTHSCSFSKTCTDMMLVGESWLTAMCKDKHGKLKWSTIDLNRIMFYDSHHKRIEYHCWYGDGDSRP